MVVSSGTYMPADNGIPLSDDASLVPGRVYQAQYTMSSPIGFLYDFLNDDWKKAALEAKVKDIEATGCTVTYTEWIDGTDDAIIQWTVNKTASAQSTSIFKAEMAGGDDLAIVIVYLAIAITVAVGIWWIVCTLKGAILDVGSAMTKDAGTSILVIGAIGVAVLYFTSKK